MIKVSNILHRPGVARLEVHETRMYAKDKHHYVITLASSRTAVWPRIIGMWIRNETSVTKTATGIGYFALFRKCNIRIFKNQSNPRVHIILQL